MIHIVKLISFRG